VIHVPEQAPGRAAVARKRSGPGRLSLALGVGTMIAGFLTGATGAEVIAGADEVPQLAIAVDNGRTAVVEGDVLTYEITVRNLATTALSIDVTQSVPPGLTFASATADGLRVDDVVRWDVDLAALAEVSLQTSMTVGPTPDDLLRLATVACAGRSADGPAVVCASHSDTLPAAATATVVVADSASSTWWYLVPGLTAAALTGGTLTARSRRRHRAGLHED
jgi:uncharacterized repeat protein (TIGR01451 family)